MALPNTGISVSLVRDTIGAGSNDVGTLCTHPNVNKWSRFRPGYWGISGVGTAGRLSFIVPDGVSADPRPTGDANRSKLAYHLGDFRLYNHDALPLRFSGSQALVRTVKVVPGTLVVNNGIFFQTGELDWTGAELQVNGQNMLGASFPNPAEWLIVDSGGAILARANIGNIADEAISLYWEQNAQTVNTKTVYLGIGYGSTIKAIIPELYNTVSISIRQQPKASILALSSLVTQAANESGYSIFRIDINPASVSLLKNDTSFNRSYTFTGVDSSSNYYNITAAPNSRVYYDIVYIKEGVVIESSSNLYVTAPSGMSITIPFSHALDYDEQVDVKFRSFVSMVIV